MVTPAPDAWGTRPEGSTATTATMPGQPSPRWWDHGHPWLSTHHTTRARGTQGGPGWHPPGRAKMGSYSTYGTAISFSTSVLPSEPPKGAG